MPRKVSGFAALLLIGGGVGCDTAMAPAETNVRVVTSDEHPVQVVSVEGANSVEVTILFSVQNHGRAPIYLAVNCLDRVWAAVYSWDGTRRSDPDGLSNPFVADCGVNAVRIEPGEAVESSVFLSGPLPAEDAPHPFDGEYRLVLDALFTQPVAGEPAEARDAALVPESQRISNPFELDFQP